MSYDKIGTEKGVTKWDDGGTTRYQDAETGKWLSEDDARRRLRSTGGGISTGPVGYDFVKTELSPIQHWPRRTEWKAIVGQPIEEVSWAELRAELREIWSENDFEYTHFFAGIEAIVTGGSDSFETELKTLTMDTRTDAWPTSLYGDFGAKLEQLFMWADDYDSVFIVSVRTVGKVHTNA